MKSQQEIIDEVMDYLNFEKIQKTMKMLNWQWYDIGVPDVPELRKTLRKLLKTFIDENLKALECGGFCIYKLGDYIKVSFAINSWDVNLNKEE